MEVVIKIPDGEYEDLIGLYKLGLDQHAYKTFIEMICVEAIANGTPLPEGHGRLIDADKLDTSCGIRTVDCPGNCDKCSDCVVKYEDIHNAKTIVEADKENDDGAGNQD